MKSMRGLSLLFLLFTALAGGTFAQVNTYSDQMPSLTPFKTLYNAEIEVSLHNAPPGALIWWTASLLANHETPFFEQASFDPQSFDFTGTLYTGIADAQGRHLLRIPPLDNPGYEDRIVRLDVLVKDPKAAQGLYRIAVCIQVLNPSLYFSSLVSENTGAISQFDELEGRLTSRIQPIFGRPGKIVFSPDFRMGFVMLDMDRVAVFDNLYNRVVHIRQTGLGLADIAVTPDGRKLIVLTRGVEDERSAVPPSSSLWIYNAQDLSQRPLKADIGPVSSSGQGDMIALSEDSSLVYVRQTGMFVGEYNLFTQRFHRFRVGNRNHFNGEVHHIELFKDEGRGLGEFLLALVRDPQGASSLHVVNTQVYTDWCYPLGERPRDMKLYRGHEAHEPRVAVLDEGDEEKDLLWLLDLLNGEKADLIVLPDGAGDFTVSDTSRLCMILYPEDGGKGRVRFYDLENRRLLTREIPVNLGDDGRVYLSRTDLSTGYVYSSTGEITIIDMERLRISGGFHLNGFCTERAVEIY